MVDLLTERLEIATPDEKQIEQVFRIMSTGTLAARTGFKKMEDKSEAEGQIRWAMRTDNMFVISDKSKKDKVIGLTILTPEEINTPQGTLTNYDICYFIELQSQGYGYMTEALTRIKSYLFDERKADRLTIYLEPDNEPSRKVALKSGFKFNHIEKDASCKYDGKIVDLEFYVLNRCDTERREENKMENYLYSQKWINEGGVLFPIPGSASLLTTPGNGVFRIFEQPRTNRIGLEKIAEAFSFNFKIYGTEGKEINDLIIHTWESEVFRESGKNLGVIFNGVKGTGKTIAAKLLCNRIGLPTIVITKPCNELLEFIQSLNFEAVILIDEAEKTFKDDSEVLLKMIDGVYNSRRKLYILTTNELSLDDNLLGRPGRIRYIKEFGNLSLDIIKEVIDDLLSDKSLAENLMSLVNKLEISTIDILKSLIEECNITGNIPNPNLFNVPLSMLKVKLLHFDDLNEDWFEEFKQFIASAKKISTPIDQWIREKRRKEDKGKDCTWKSFIENKFDCKVRIESIPIRDKNIEKGRRLRYYKVTTSPDLNGFFCCESEYSDGQELFCLIGFTDRPTLYNEQ